jgi:hypothetical protein
MRFSVRFTLLCVMLLLATEAQAARVNIAEVLDRVCVASRLDRDLIRRLGKYYADHSSLEFQEFPADQLALMSADNKDGWAIIGEGSGVVVIYAEKRDPTFFSRSCGVATPDLDLAGAKRIIEENYNVRLLKEARQGSSDVLMYSAELAEFGSGTFAISVQFDRLARAVLISLYEAQP